MTAFLTGLSTARSVLYALIITGAGQIIHATLFLTPYLTKSGVGTTTTKNLILGTTKSSLSMSNRR